MQSGHGNLRDVENRGFEPEIDILQPIQHAGHVRALRVGIIILTRASECAAVKASGEILQIDEGMATNHTR
jgi:hypothetical protein